MNFKTFNDLALDIKNNLYKIHTGDYDLVVGIPRSGMIPAYIIGLYINVNVTDLESYILNNPFKKAATRKLKHPILFPHEAKKVLLVDDSIISGNSLEYSLEKIPISLKHKVTKLIIYTDHNKRDDIDMYIEVLPLPRAFEWNIFHRKLLERACVDIDGVLCKDPTDDQNDDGSKYIDFLLNAKPHLLTSYKIHSLVTSRLEKYRPQTEIWLKKNNINYDNLIMLDLPSKEARLKNNAHATHKAKYFKSMKELEIFIESNPEQAREIMEITGKPVFSVDQNFMHKPGLINEAFKNPNMLYRKTYMRIAINMPSWLKSILKPIYKFIFQQNKN